MNRYVHINATLQRSGGKGTYQDYLPVHQCRHFCFGALLWIVLMVLSNECLYAQEGNIVWADSCVTQSFYGKIQTQGYSDFSRIHTLSNGDFIAIGTIKDNFSQMAIARNYAHLMCITKEGTMRWSKFIGIRDSTIQVDLRTYGSTVARNGDIILLTTLAAGNRSGNYVMRMDADGNLLWQKRIETLGGMPLDMNVACAVKELSNLEIEVMGYNNNNGVFVRLQSDGAVKWSNGIGSGDCDVKLTAFTETPNSIFVVGFATSRVTGYTSCFVARMDKMYGALSWVKWIGYPNELALTRMTEFLFTDIQYRNGTLAITGNTYFLYNGTNPNAQLTVYMDEDGNNITATQTGNGNAEPEIANQFQGALCDPFNETGIQFRNSSGGDYYTYQLKNQPGEYKGWKLILPEIQCANDCRRLADSSLLIAGFNRDANDVVMACITKTNASGNLEACDKTAYNPVISHPTLTLQHTANFETIVGAGAISASALDTLSGRGFLWQLQCNYAATCRISKIAGKSVLCKGSGNIFSVHKSASCTGNIVFTTDASAVVTPLSDTSASVTFPATGEYHVYAAFSSSCGLLKDTFSVTVTESAQVLSLGADTSICPGGRLVLKPNTGFNSYQWQDGSTAPYFTATHPGIYYLTVTDACGFSLSDTIKLTAVSVAPFSAGPDRQKCRADTLHLIADTGFSNYEWSPAYNISNTRSPEVVVYPSTDTFYIVSATADEGCTVADTVFIQVLQSPPLYLPKDSAACLGKQLLINLGTAFRFYRWNDGLTGASREITAPGLYIVQAEDNNGCVVTDSLSVSTAGCVAELFIPSAFSPDNNGLNDVFRPIASYTLQYYRLQVYDRWGRQVFVSADIMKGWNGTVADKPAASGAYTWICTYRFTGKQEITKQGTLLLLR